MVTDRRHTITLGRVEEESADVRTFYFYTDLDASAGQFVMLTDFCGGEKPFSISDCGTGYFTVTIKKVGPFTSRLFTLGAGDIVSFRGAYGSSFFVPCVTLTDKNFPEGAAIQPEDFRAVLAGGGFGLPPLYFLARRLIAAGVPASSLRVIGAARTEEGLLFERRFEKLGIQYTGAVESVSSGGTQAARVKGTAADALAALNPEPGSFVYASGPDLMMKSLLPVIGGSIEYQFLFERYMKCAIGICGSCVVEPGGIRICKEGPALYRRQVEQIEDFGAYRRLASGSREFFKDRLASAPDNHAETAGQAGNGASV